MPWFGGSRLPGACDKEDQEVIKSKQNEILCLVGSGISKLGIGRCS